MTKLFLDLAKTTAMYLTTRDNDVSTFILNGSDRLYLNLASGNKQVHNRVLGIRNNSKNGCRYVTLMLQSGDVVEIEKTINGVTVGAVTIMVERWLFKDGKVVMLPTALDKQKPVLVKLTRSRAHSANMNFLSELGILDHLVTRFRRCHPITITTNPKPKKFNLNTLDNYIAYSAIYRDGKYEGFSPITPNNLKSLDIESKDVIFAIPVDSLDQRDIICYTNDPLNLTNLINAAETFYVSGSGDGNYRNWTILPKHTVDDFDKFS